MATPLGPQAERVEQETEGEGWGWGQCLHPQVCWLPAGVGDGCTALTEKGLGSRNLSKAEDSGEEVKMGGKKGIKHIPSV